MVPCPMLMIIGSCCGCVSGGARGLDTALPGYSWGWGGPADPPKGEIQQRVLRVPPLSCAMLPSTGHRTSLPPAGMASAPSCFSVELLRAAGLALFWFVFFKRNMTGVSWRHSGSSAACEVPVLLQGPPTLPSFPGWFPQGLQGCLFG